MKFRHLNPIQDGEGERGWVHKDTPYQFFPCDFYKLAPKTFWLLALILLLHWCKISRLYLVPVQNYWTRIKTIPQQKLLFLIKSPHNWGYKNFSQRNAKVTKLWSHDHIYNIFESCDKFFWWLHRQELWRHNLYFKIALF